MHIIARALIFVLAGQLMACSGTSTQDTATANSNATTLPDGTSCAAAPADYTGAQSTWETFLTWQQSTALGCGLTETWPGYACIVTRYDPRRIADFTQCMMADGCNTVSAEDSCLIDPPNKDAGDSLPSSVTNWLNDVCFPKSDTCGFTDDYCNVFQQVVRPEIRCDMYACIQKPCTEVVPCIDALKSKYAFCSD